MKPNQSDKKNDSLKDRSIVSVSWNAIAQLVQISVGVVRSILLARLLPVDVFGIYGWASSIVSLTSVIPNFGMGSAFMHRSPETRNEQQAAAIQFTLQLLFVSLWAGALCAITLMFTTGENRTALLVLIATSIGSQLTHTPSLILRRRVMHRRIALYHIINVLISALIAVALAIRGVNLWALLSTDIMRVIVGIIVFYIWRPIWKPRLAWSSKTVRYFLSFGSRQFIAEILVKALDRVDDLWTGTYLGNSALGYYSRAYTFATYPRKLLAHPINLVVGGTYAELKENRQRMSIAFFRVNALLVRTGFVIAGVLSLIAPEFIRIALGSKWLPFLYPFRLMLVYTLLDPIRDTVANLFVALGKPELIIQTRLIQLGILIAGLFGFGYSFGITGVAIAADIMVVVGIAILLWQTRPYVDFSLLKLFAVPGLGLIAGLLTAWLSVSFLDNKWGDLYTALIKITVFIAIYFIILVIFERQSVTIMFSYMKYLMHRLHPVRTSHNYESSP